MKSKDCVFGRAPSEFMGKVGLDAKYYNRNGVMKQVDKPDNLHRQLFGSQMYLCIRLLYHIVTYIWAQFWEIPKGEVHLLVTLPITC